ncbi:hypothetical protein ACSBR2_022198 [Camellia fascicularis]
MNTHKIKRIGITEETLSAAARGLRDIRSLTLIKTYVTEHPVNAVAMSPLLDHVVLGGGQDASAVATTDHCSGKFEAKFFDKGPRGRINRAVWGPLNKTIVSAGEDAIIRIWNSETGKLLKESDKETGHKKTITSLTKSADSSHLLTGSLDKSAKLWDIRSLTLIKTYVTERPVNAVAMSPLLDHVVLGRGQDASAVTTTDHCAGKFEARFFGKVLQEEIGGVKGHFGPINALAFNPDETGESLLTIKGPQGRINRAVWGPLNKTIISAGEDAVVHIWDSETGKLLKESDKETGHKKTITSLTKSADSSHLLTGSLDKSAKLWDIRSLTLIKTYVTECPVNAVAMSPLLDHVVLGGGQDASAVATTDHCSGKFEAKFFDKRLVSLCSQSRALREE